MHKNRLFDARCSAIRIARDKDRRHAAFDYKYHLIDMLRLSKFTSTKALTSGGKLQNTPSHAGLPAQKRPVHRDHSSSIALCIITPIVKGGVQLLTVNNILNILQQASPRMFLALGVAGLIPARRHGPVHRPYGRHGHDRRHPRHAQGHQHRLGVRRHVRPHRPAGARARAAGARRLRGAVHGVHHHRRFLHSQVQDAPFISTMANMLVIFGLVTYSTKGVSFGGIETEIPA